MSHLKTYIFSSCLLVSALAAQGTFLANSTNLAPTANADLGAKIRSALQNNTGLTPNGRSIQATAENGKVTLSGTLNSTAERSRVEAIVKGVSGVKSVTNNIKIKSITSK